MGINGFEGVGPEWLLPKKKESLFTFWKKARFEGGERETDLPVHAYCITAPFSLIFSLFFSVFFLIFFFFFLLCFSFYSIKMFCFSIPLSGHGKGPFIVPAVTNLLPFYKACTQRFLLKLVSFGWSVILAGRTSQKGLGRSRKINLFPSPHHQTIPPLPLTSGPWPHHVLYWLGTG